jgi:hypothetical protein
MIWDYAAARLDERDSDRVRKHLNSCTKCTDELEACRVSLRSLEAVVDHTLPQSRRGWDEIRGRIHAEAPAAPVASPSRVRWQTAFSMSGALAAGALCTLIVVGPMMRHDTGLTFTPRPSGAGLVDSVVANTQSPNRDSARDSSQSQVGGPSASIKPVSSQESDDEPRSANQPRIRMNDWLVNKHSDLKIVPVDMKTDSLENIDGKVLHGTPSDEERKRNYVIGRISNLSDTPVRTAGHESEPQAW